NGPCRPGHQRDARHGGSGYRPAWLMGAAHHAWRRAQHLAGASPQPPALATGAGRLVADRQLREASQRTSPIALALRLLASSSPQSSLGEPSVAATSKWLRPAPMASFTGTPWF